MGLPTYDPIQTVTLGSDAASISFSSIPATYTDLVLVIVSAVDGATNTYIRCRYNATSTGYSETFLEGDGTSATSTRNTADSYGYMGNLLASSTNFSVSIVHIQNYANTSINKTYIARGNNASLKTSITVGLWSNTAAINAITLYPGTFTNFKAGSKVTLFGIKAA